MKAQTRQRMDHEARVLCITDGAKRVAELQLRYRQ